MRDEYIPAFLELAKAFNDKALLDSFSNYQKVKEASDESFKANEKRVVELQFDRNHLENEKAALAKDKVALGLGIYITRNAIYTDTTAVGAGEVKVKLSRTV